MMKNIHFSYNLVLLVLLSLGFLPQDVTGGNGWKYGPIDCGCPNSCGEVAWGETNGAPWTCYDRIHYFKGHYHLNDTDACLASVHDPTMTDEENKVRPCNPDYCHPYKCTNIAPPGSETNSEDDSESSGGSNKENTDNAKVVDAMTSTKHPPKAQPV